MTPETFQGRLTAHRRLLGLILAELAQRGEAGLALEVLRDQQVPQDGQEDPGAVPDEALAFLLAMADEFRKVEEAMRRYQSTAKGDPAEAGAGARDAAAAEAPGVEPSESAGERAGE